MIPAPGRGSRTVSCTIAAAALALLAPLSACSIQKMAIHKLGGALASGSSVYAQDDDPELVKDALPFGLKTMEALLAQAPRDKNLLVAATSGFTQYSVAFLQYEADFVEATDLPRADELRRRSVGLDRRALAYGLRALEVDHPGFAGRLREDAPAALAPMRKIDVPALYWTGAAWGAAISTAKNDPELAADLSLAEALMHRALELDECFGDGAIHDFYIAYEGGRPAAAGGSVERARRSLEDSLRCSGGKRAAPLVSFAETVAVGAQDKKEFETLLRRALAIDVNAAPDQRLANVIAQKRARWLLERESDLFVD